LTLNNPNKSGNKSKEKGRFGVLFSCADTPHPSLRALSLLDRYPLLERGLDSRMKNMILREKLS